MTSRPACAGTATSSMRARIRWRMSLPPVQGQFERGARFAAAVVRLAVPAKLPAETEPLVRLPGLAVADVRDPAGGLALLRVAAHRHVDELVPAAAVTVGQHVVQVRVDGG